MMVTLEELRDFAAKAENHRMVRRIPEAILRRAHRLFSHALVTAAVFSIPLECVIVYADGGAVSRPRGSIRGWSCMTTNLTLRGGERENSCYRMSCVAKHGRGPRARGFYMGVPKEFCRTEEDTLALLHSLAPGHAITEDPDGTFTAPILLPREHAAASRLASRLSSPA